MARSFFGILACVCVVLVAAAPVAGQEGDKPQPCSDPQYSQFDFWVGDWRVTDTDGVHQGDNRVEKILGGCAIQENWTGAKGTTGRSFNIWAKGRRSWHQTWVDSNGMLLRLDGGFTRGKMVLKGQTPIIGANGTLEHEISWEPLDDGSVRQVWRMSSDGGSTWKNAFVGLYTRKK
jgi:hypothetical protein